MTLRLDYSNMMILPGGVDQKTWTSASERFAAAKAGFDKLRGSGAVGFVDLASDSGLLEQVEGFVAGATGRFDDVVILGIGGSALGPIALSTALRPSDSTFQGSTFRRTSAAVSAC